MNVNIAMKLESYMGHFKDHPYYDSVYNSILSLINDEVQAEVGLKQDAMANRDSLKHKLDNLDNHYIDKFKDLERVFQEKLAELQKESDGYARKAAAIESNYINELSLVKNKCNDDLRKMKDQYETELQMIEHRYEDSVQDVKSKAESDAMKKYKGEKYEKLKLDVDFGSQMNELRSIKFNNL